MHIIHIVNRISIYKLCKYTFATPILSIYCHCVSEIQDRFVILVDIDSSLDNLLRVYWSSAVNLPSIMRRDRKFASTFATNCQMGVIYVINNLVGIVKYNVRCVDLMRYLTRTSRSFETCLLRIQNFQYARGEEENFTFGWPIKVWYWLINQSFLNQRILMV